MLPGLTSYEPQAQSALTGAYNAAGAAIPQNVSNQTIQNMPGYQFNLSQGLNAVQNANAAKGLGVSGNALRGAANFATGLANNYYQNYFANQQGIYSDLNQQFSNLYNQENQGFSQLYQPAALGENAAAQSGSIGQAGAAAAGQNIAAAGQALAAGTSAQANALNNGLSALGNAPMNYYIANALQNGGGGGGYVDSGTLTA